MGKSTLETLKQSIPTGLTKPPATTDEQPPERLYRGASELLERLNHKANDTDSAGGGYNRELFGEAAVEIERLEKAVVAEKKVSASTRRIKDLVIEGLKSDLSSSLKELEEARKALVELQDATVPCSGHVVIEGWVLEQIELAKESTS